MEQLKVSKFYWVLQDVIVYKEHIVTPLLRYAVSKNSFF